MPDIDFQKIKQTREELKEFLKQHPELQALQDEIDEALSKCNNQHNRCVKIQELMLEKWFEIIEPANKLSGAYEDFVKPKTKLEVIDE